MELSSLLSLRSSAGPTEEPVPLMLAMFTAALTTAEGEVQGQCPTLVEWLDEAAPRRPRRHTENHFQRANRTEEFQLVTKKSEQSRPNLTNAR